MTKRNAKQAVSAHKQTAATQAHSAQSTPTQVDIHDPSARRAALAAIRPAALSIPENEYAPRNLSSIDMASFVLTHLPGIQALRDRMIAEIVHPPIEQLDQLESTALAAYQADIEAGFGVYTPSELEKLYQSTILPRRRRLFMVAELLVEMGLLASARVEATRRGTSHRDEIASMMAIAGVLREVWSSIDGKVPITLVDLDEADVAGQEFLYAQTHRDRTPDAALNATRLRDAVLTLLLQKYDDVRKAVFFVRWAQQDADTIAPSPYVSRVKHRRRASEETEPSATPDAEKSDPATSDREQSAA